MVFHRTFIKAGIASIVLAVTAPTQGLANEPIPVVATFSILGDMVERIGGSAVIVTSLVGRNGDTHVFKPTPADASAVQGASLLFTNGLEFEGWLERLGEAAEFGGEVVVTTDGIDVLAFDEHDDDDHQREGHHDDDHDEHKDEEHHGDGEHAAHDEGHGHHDHGQLDPHAWQSLKNAVVYVDNITTALAKMSPENAGSFYENRASYLSEIEAVDAEIKDMIAEIPEDARTIITSHDAFQYFGRDYGLTFRSPRGLSTESEPSARDVARLIEQIRADGISAVFVENIADPRLLKQIANETGSVIGGQLYPGGLSEEGGPAATYLDLMRHNATTIATALKQAF